MSATAFDTIRNVLKQVQAPAAAPEVPARSSADQYHRIADESARRYGIDPGIFSRQIQQESGFNPRAVSPAGARGIAQIMPATAKGWGVNPDDPTAALNAAAKNMSAYYNTYKKQGHDDRTSYGLALAAYNAGPGSVARYGTRILGGHTGVRDYDTQTYHYIKNILGGNAPVASRSQDPVSAVATQPQRQSIDISIPQMRPGQAFAPLPQGLTNFSVPTRQQSQANNKAAQSAVKQATLDPAVTQPTAAHPALDGIRKVLDDVKRAPKLPPAATTPAHSDTNFAGDLYNHAVNRLSGSTQDQLVRDSGHGWGAGIGDFIGDVGFIGAGTLGGAGLGGLTLTPFGVGAGAVGGGVVAAGTAGAAQELQRQRLAGEQADYLKAAGSGAIQAGLQLIPVVKGASLLTTVGKNAALQGGGAAIGSVGQQAIEQGTLTPKLDTRRIINEAGLGAAGGTVGAGIEHRFGNARVPREIEPPSAPRDVIFKGGGEKPDVQELTKAFKERQRPETKELFDPRTQEIPQELGPLRTETSEGGIVIATRAGKREPKELTIERGLPSSRREYTYQEPAKENKTNPITGQEYEPKGLSARESGATFRAHGEDLKTAERIHADAQSEFNRSVDDVLEAGGDNDLATAQRNVGARVNELEAIANTGRATADDASELSRLRETLENLRQRSKDLNEASSLLEDIRRPSPRSEIETPQPTAKNAEILQSAPEKQLPSTRELSLRRAEAITQAGEGAAKNISQGGSPRQRVREIGDSGLLDASGSPISRPKPSAEILTPGNAERPQTRELELPSSYRREVPQEPAKATETPDAAAVSTVSSENKQGSFTDTINEILKDSGTDFEGVRSLKAEMDRLSEIAKTGGRAGAREAKAQLKDLKERWKAVPENVRELAGSDFDPESGIGKQRAVNPESQHTLDRVRGELDAQAGPIAERINEALQKGTRVRLKYIGEQVGRSNEVAKLSKGGKAVVQASEFSPTHFGYFNATYADGKRRVPAVFGYNQRGHQVGYYLNKSPKGSHIQQVLSVTDKPAFRGAMANVYHGAGDYNVSDVLARGPRTERGFVKTSEAIRALHEQKKAIREAAAQDANLSPDVKSTMERLFSGQEFSYDDIKAMRKEMSDPSRLATFCKHMGLT